MLGQQETKSSKTGIQEGAKVVNGIGKFAKKSELQPTGIDITQKNQTVESFILFPNRRLEEMEAGFGKNPNIQFRVNGDIYTHKKHKYLLVREVTSLVEHIKRDLPTTVPDDPSPDVVEENSEEVSVADIVKKLKGAAGQLTQTIRNANANPITKGVVKEGARISSRRCRLIRNTLGAWVAVFISDSSGLDDPPCTVLPTSKLLSLSRWINKQKPSTPVLLSGELLSYHGHRFLLLHSWRDVHNTDHLDD